MDLLNRYASIHQNFTFEIIEGQKQGRLSIDNMTVNINTSVSMCGPKPMMDGLVKSIRNVDKNIELHVEGFSFTGNLVNDVFEYIVNLTKRTFVNRQQ